MGGQKVMRKPILNNNNGEVGYDEIMASIQKQLNIPWWKLLLPGDWSLMEMLG